MLELHGNVGSVGLWVPWVRGSVGCVGQFFTLVALVTWVRIFFYVGQYFKWVIIFTWVAWVKYVFAWVQNFLRWSLRGSQFFAWVTTFCVGGSQFFAWV